MKIEHYNGGSGGIMRNYHNLGYELKASTRGIMHLEVERYIGVLEDYSIVYLMECEKCGVLVAFQGQGHNCGGIVDVTPEAKFEAEYLATFMVGLKKLYTLKKFDTGPQ
jgi:hypothetical protein